MAVNWGLGVLRDDPGNTFMEAFQRGQQMRREQEGRNALTAYAQDPSEVNLNGLAQFAPELVIQQKQAMAQRAAQQQEQRRADLPMLARLLDYAAKGPDAYIHARQIAQQYGIDVSQIPPEFNAAWVDEQRATLHALSDPAKQEALSTAGKIAADMGFRPGTPEHAQKTAEIFQAQEAKPYVVGGETRLYTPRLGGAGEVAGQPSDAHIAALRQHPDRAAEFDAKFGQGAAARILGQGGPTQPASGNFRPVGDAAGIVQQIFPGIHVTQGRRDPNSALGRANPNSWHNRTGAAVDVRPIPGMSFDQYLSGIRAKGFNIIEARDEVKNPSRHATGPHWHVVIGE